MDSINKTKVKEIKKYQKKGSKKANKDHQTINNNKKVVNKKRKLKSQSVPVLIINCGTLTVHIAVAGSLKVKNWAKCRECFK